MDIPQETALPSFSLRRREGIEIAASDWRDFSALLKLQKQILHEAEHLVATGAERRESFLFALAKAFLHRKRVYTLVAKDGKELVGYVTIVIGKFKKVRETVYLVIGVRASHRGRGIGTKLLERAEQFARDRNMHRIELEVSDKNEGAIRLYEKLGYVVEGRRREATKTKDGYTDIIWMGKLLSEEQERV